MYACKYCGSHEFGIDIISMESFKGLEVYCKNCNEAVEDEFINHPPYDETFTDNPKEAA